MLKVPGIRHLENLSFRTLDNTRISPEMYRLAIQLAQAAAGAGDAEEALEKRDKVGRGERGRGMWQGVTVGRRLGLTALRSAGTFREGRLEGGGFKSCVRMHPDTHPQLRRRWLS